MNEYLNKLKTTPTQELAMLLSSGINGSEYKDVLKEYITRNDKRNIKPCRKLKNRKSKPQIDLDNITRDYLKLFNIRELKGLMATGVIGDAKKLIYTEYLNRIHILRAAKN